ncbi:helicase UvrD [Bacillus sp. TS-2]|nr:helicase UvrD [Bacillus sp. TS-2]
MTFKYEEKILNQIQNKLMAQYEEVKNKPIYYGDDFNLQVLEDNRKKREHYLQKALEEPYFGRLDFQNLEQKSNKETYYIGKQGINDEQSGHLLITDWRAPIASLFYAFSGSEEDVYYQSPDGLVEGEIHLKRNLVIRNSELTRSVDSFVKGQTLKSGGDEFLLYKLGEQKDNRLRDIVATIQGEQNNIIRHPPHQAVLIQGVAGSGKTTVALHRLAYLLYEYRETLKANRMIIFAPNAVFLDYISQVLPELGVGDIKQTTFADWALETLEDPKLNIIPLAQKRKPFFEMNEETKEDSSLEADKKSPHFKKQIEDALDLFEKRWIPTEDFEAWPGAVFPISQLMYWFEHDFQKDSVFTKYERTKSRLKRWIEIEVKQFSDKKEQQQAKKEAMQRLRSYLRKWKKETPYHLYVQILKNLKFEQAIPEKNQLDIEDLAPLIHIQLYWYGIDKTKKFDHVVIDEAQDFSYYQLSLLKSLTRGHSFTIFGDLAQGIHSNEGIEHWNEFISLWQAHQFAYFEITKSYRSTYEIIEFSNRILTHLEKKPSFAEPVFRSGEPVQISHLKNEDSINAIKNWIKTMQSKEMRTMAIISRTQSDSEKYYEQLKHLFPKSALLGTDDSQYNGGISFLPVYVSKGLEFDAVLIVDADQKNYPLNPLSTKLLYVACTRALHHLTIMHQDNPSFILNDEDY